MATLRMDHVSVVVEDLPGAIAFFTELGLTTAGTARLSGDWVDRVNGMSGLDVEIAMMATPDGHGRLELTRFHAPDAIPSEPAPSHVTGLRSVMFEVDDVRDTVERLRAHGGELIGEVTPFEDQYVLCYLRGPAGIIVALAESVAPAS